MRGRRKFQNPRPKKVKVDGVQYWRLQFRDIDGRPRTKSLGRAADLSYREADEKAREILEPVNAATVQTIRKSQITIGQFVNEVFLPRQRNHWKESTANTTTDEIERYLLEFPPRLPAWTPTLAELLSQQEPPVKGSSVDDSPCGRSPIASFFF